MFKLFENWLSNLFSAFLSKFSTSTFLVYRAFDQSTENNKTFELSDEDLNIIVGQTNCSVALAREAYSTLGDPIDSILYILEGGEQYKINEERQQPKNRINEEDNINLKNINKLRVIVDDKDAIYEAIINR